MVKKSNQIILDRKEVENFLAEKEKEITISGARVIQLNQEAEKLEKEVKETDKKLRLML